MYTDGLIEHEKSGLWLPDIGADWWLAVLNSAGTFETDTLDAGLKFVRPASYGLALDIGAHVGTASRYLSSLACFHRIKAFEPHPENFRCLVANTEGLPVDCRRVALGARDGRCSLAYHGHTSSEFYVIDGADHELRRLDSLGYEDVTFMKIDVEGYELRVLEGARDTIRRCRPVILLESTDAAYQHSLSPSAAPAFLEDLGMRRVAQTPDYANLVYAWNDPA